MFTISFPSTPIWKGFLCSPACTKYVTTLGGQENKDLDANIKSLTPHEGFLWQAQKMPMQQDMVTYPHALCIIPLAMKILDITATSVL